MIKPRPAAPPPVTGPKVVLVTTVATFARTHRPEFLTEDVLAAGPSHGALGERALFIHDARHESTLFTALPEHGQASEDAEFILDELEDFAAEQGEQIEALLGPGPRGRELEWGLHTEAAYADVVALFERDGFRIAEFPAGG